MSVGFCQNPLAAGKGGLSLGMPLSPSKKLSEQFSSPHTNAPAPALIVCHRNRSRFRRYFCPESFFSGLSHGDLKSLDGQRIFGTALDDALGGSIAYRLLSCLLSECGLPQVPNGPWHAQVSFVGVAYQIFSFPGLCFAAFHLNHVGKPAPPLPRSPISLSLLLLLQGFMEPGLFYGLVRLQLYVILYVLRIDDSAVSQNYSLLFCHELLILFGDGFILRNFCLPDDSQLFHLRLQAVL